MLVSIITPTTPDREGMLAKLEQYINAQDYPNIEWLIDESNECIGAKRNNLVSQAKGEVICNLDSDDYYAPDWVSKSVQHLISSKANITGLSSAYFQSDQHKWLWKWPSNAPYVCEATMCYWRTAWEQHPFTHTNSGEGIGLLANNGLIIPHTYIDGFTAMIHGNNTASHKMLSVMELIY